MQPRPLASAWSLMVSGAMDINSDPGYGRAMDPDIAAGMALVVGMALFVGTP